eukprot:m.183803 g.183803  ORF g.183803 m.183803 type:complete len:394 (+) comp15944_c0_seq1:39-1220(+)
MWTVSTRCRTALSVLLTAAVLPCGLGLPKPLTHPLSSSDVSGASRTLTESPQFVMKVDRQARGDVDGIRHKTAWQPRPHARRVGDIVTAPLHPQQSLQLNADLHLATGRDELPPHAPADSSTSAVDWALVRTDIQELLADSTDNSLAPTVVRLAWHASGTYDKGGHPVGGVVHGGATMRFEPEAGYEENRGLQVAREALAQVLGRHPGASHADLWVLGGYVAVEHLGGPHIAFRPGRTDAPTGGALCPPESRLPTFNASADDMRDMFGRLGFNDRELVALIGAHTVGHTHEERSGFPYMQWDGTPKKFDNEFFDFLLQNWWIFDDEDPDHPHYRNRSWIMLLSDWVLREDPKFHALVKEYADDESVWHRDFAVAFKKLTELGWEDDLALSPVV